MNTTLNKGFVSINRRRVLQLMAASAGVVTMPCDLLAGTTLDQGGDKFNPQITWHKTLGDAQRKTLTVLGNFILPADEKSPSASELKIADFIDEWVSAPYPDQQQDKKIILAGLAELDRQAYEQSSEYFNQSSVDQQAELFDQLAKHVQKGTGTEEMAQFFERLVYLFVGGFYTTPQGMADIGYVGNRPQTSFDGPPKEILRLTGF